MKTEMERGAQQSKNAQKPAEAGRVVGMGGIRWELVKEARDCVCVRGLRKPQGVPSPVMVGLGWESLPTQERDHLG